MKVTKHLGVKDFNKQEVEELLIPQLIPCLVQNMTYVVETDEVNEVLSYLANKTVNDTEIREIEVKGTITDIIEENEGFGVALEIEVDDTLLTEEQTKSVIGRYVRELTYAMQMANIQKYVQSH